MLTLEKFEEATEVVSKVTQETKLVYRLIRCVVLIIRSAP